MSYSLDLYIGLLIKSVSNDNFGFCSKRGILLLFLWAVAQRRVQRAQNGQELCTTSFDGDNGVSSIGDGGGK